MQLFPDIRNTCTECGTPCEGVYAENRQEALAGLGKCAECAGVEAKVPQAEEPKVVEEPKSEAKAEQPSTKSNRSKRAKAKATS